MISPAILILAAGALQGGDEARACDPFAILLVEAADPAVLFAAEAPPTVREIPFYYDDLRPVAVPATPAVISYDPRSPVIRDLP